ncbi:MAG TPA: MlaD family protein [Candidatus Acidoferrales bacterium]|nr:MlaD family protein [Candidatus Acidoferrales bacterium]
MTNEQKVGLFFLVGIVLVFAAIEATVGTGLLSKGYDLYVNYTNVEGLRTGDAVQVAGLKLGKVDEITLKPDGVRVKLRLDTKAVVRRDSVARLDYQALSGTRFISISLGTPDAVALKDGETVEAEIPPSITQMVDQLQGVAKSVRDLADSLNRNQDHLLNNVNALIEENRTALQHTLENIDSITTKLDRGEGTMAKLINDSTLYDRASTVMSDLQKISDRLARGEGDLGRLVNGDGALYDEVRETVASLNTTATNLEEVSTRVRNGEGTLGRIVSDDALYQEAQDAVRGLDRATAGIEDQSPISVLGTLITTLF